MQKLISLLITATPTEAFALHYKKTQALVKAKQATQQDHQDEPSVVDWASADVEVLSSATDFCADEEECDVDELLNIKSAFEDRLSFFDSVVLNYSADVADVLDSHSAGDSSLDVTGATAEDRALARYVNDVKKKGLKVRRKIETIETLVSKED